MGAKQTPAKLAPEGPRLRLEPWGVDHLGSFQDAGGTTLTDDGTPGETELLSGEALAVELPLREWRALAPRVAGAEFTRVAFLDGVRRVEARVLLEGNLEGGGFAFGAVGSCGVGAVISDLERATTVYLEPHLERWCTLAGGATHADLVVAPLGARVDSGRSLTYRVASVQENDVDAPVKLLLGKMLELEVRVAQGVLSNQECDLVISDGPRPAVGSDRRALGYLKTVRAQRLPPAALTVVRSLAAGERSPLYLVPGWGPQLFEWYVRLRDPGPYAHTLAGSVRLQAYAGSQPSEQLTHAQEVADWSARVLPRFSTGPHQDPRAPQQLLPVRALESMLRRRLGNPQLLRRWLTASLARGVQGA